MRFPGVLVPSESRVVDHFYIYSNMPLIILHIMYYMRQCKTVKLAARLGSVFN
jgi:hypothetical protein